MENERLQRDKGGVAGDPNDFRRSHQRHQEAETPAPMIENRDPGHPDDRYRNLYREQTSQPFNQVENVTSVQRFSMCQSGNRIVNDSVKRGGQGEEFAGGEGNGMKNQSYSSGNMYHGSVNVSSSGSKDVKRTTHTRDNTPIKY